MCTLRLRDWRVLAAVALAALAVLVWGAFDREERVEAHREVLFTLPWGDGDGSVARVPVDGRVFGPRSFAVAGDRVFVADTFNRRVLVLDLAGRQLQSFVPPADPAGTGSAAGVLPDARAAGAAEGEGQAAGAPWINDIAVAADGHIYLADAAAPRILVLAPDGTAVGSVDVAAAAPGEDPAGDAVWLLERVAVADRGVLYLTHAYLSDAVLSRRITRVGGVDAKFAHLSSASLREGTGVVIDEESLLPVPANSFAVGHDGRLYVESAGPNLFTRLVRAYDEDIRPAGSWEISRPRPVRTADVLGAAPPGWVYLALHPGRPEGRILVLAPERGVVYELDPGWAAGFEANVFVRLARDALYVARPGEDGWTLERWEIRRRWQLRAALAER